LFSEYESESKTSTGSALSLYTSLLPTPPPPSSSPSSTIPPSFYKMSQHNLHAIIWQQQEQLVAMQAQL